MTDDNIRKMDNATVIKMLLEAGADKEAKDVSERLQASAFSLLQPQKDGRDFI